jgi:hypothetical protein
MKFTKQIEAEIHLSPLDLAELFAGMMSDDQATFLSHVAHLSDQWEGLLVMQLQYISDSKNLTDKGRELMRLIGDYAEKTTK